MMTEEYYLRRRARLEGAYRLGWSVNRTAIEFGYANSAAVKKHFLRFQAEHVPRSDVAPLRRGPYRYVRPPGPIIGTAIAA